MPKTDPEATSDACQAPRATKALVIVPAFNEKGAIANVLLGIRAIDPPLPVLVVDDGSLDETSAIGRSCGARVVRLPFNMGVGVALQTGYKYALREGFDCVVQLDADGQHEPADIPALLEVIAGGEADMVVGSRFIGAAQYRMPAFRRLGARLFGFLAFLLSGCRFTDVTSGFRAIGADVLRFFVSERYPDDYPDADVLLMLARAGFIVKEVPVRMYERTTGQSQHAGLRPLYYVFKMLLSVVLTSVRRETVPQKGM